MKIHLPLGESDFRRIREEGDYYIDKTLLIKEVMDANRIVLITRPRRFGKTLNMTTLRYFYDCEKDYRHLFQGLAIMQCGEQYLSKMGRHPVLFMSLKNIKDRTWADAYAGLSTQMRSIYQSYPFDVEKLSDWEKEIALRFIAGKQTRNDYEHGLKLLSKGLFLSYGVNPVIIIDEYDTPLISAWLEGYYSECVLFLRDMFSDGLKDNPYLEKAIITGIVRVTKESLFSGLNNLTTFSMLDKGASDKFGFTEPEVKQLLADADLNGKQLTDIRAWYDGYIIGGKTNVYNPWSVLSYVFEQPEYMRAFWVNTSDNRLVKELLFDGQGAVREDIDALIRGEWLPKILMEHLVFSDIRIQKEAVWQLLLASGYLKIRNIHYNYDIAAYECELAIPNEEVRFIFGHSIRIWLTEQMEESKYDEMLRHLLAGRTEPFSNLLHRFVLGVASYHDTAKPDTENFYHAFFLGLFIKLADRYIIRSNRESWYGRYDILMIPKDKNGKGIVIEIKAPMAYSKDKTLRQALNAAVRQLKTQAYVTELQELGIKDILQLAIAVEGKEFLLKEVPVVEILPPVVE